MPEEKLKKLVIGKEQKMNKILFAGGGTMGSVVPLLAVAEILKQKDPSLDLFWLGTKKGIENEIIKNYNLEFKAISSGKLRRYFSWQNFADIFKIIIGFLEAIVLLKKIKPRVIVSAGGFVAVPVIWAGWLLGIPSLIHQQDIRVGLANRLCAVGASRITVCFPRSLVYFNKRKTSLVGNPVREALRDRTTGVIKQNLYKKYNLNSNLSTVLFMGGGRGAESINNLVSDSINQLVTFCQVVHITGKLKIKTFKSKIINNYIIYDFLVDNTELLSLADLIVSRAGMGTLTELAYLSKPSIIIPIPDSHQVDNAKYFKNKQAIVMLDQKDLDEEKLLKVIRILLSNKKKMKVLGDNIHQIIQWGAEKEISEIILQMIKH